ncbi:MAG: hypothetical protein ABF289_12065 [Clostridiales bacterium]
MKKTILFFIVLFFSISINIYAESNNLAQNPGFEQNNNDKVQNWELKTWKNDNNVTKSGIDNSIFKSGNKSTFIENISANDSRFIQEIEIKKNTYYKVSCWVKTENIGTEKIGANISIYNLTIWSSDIKGTNNWQQLNLYFKSGKDSDNVSISLGIGNYGNENTGKAWFDDLEIIELDNAPSNVQMNNLEVANKNKEDKVVDFVKLSNEKLVFFTKYFIIALIVVCLIFGIRYLINKKTYFKINQKSDLWIIMTLLVSIGLILRIWYRLNYYGHSIDINNFNSWAARASNNLFTTYKDGVFVDYPPGYILILAITGKIATFFNYTINDTIPFSLINNLPSILADLGIGIILFFISLKKLSKGASILIAAIFILNPLPIVFSSLWGQVDSFFTLFIILTIMFLIKDKYIEAIVALTVSFFVKPQGIIFIPIIGYAFIMYFIKMVKSEIKRNENSDWKKATIKIFKTVVLKKLLLASLFSLIAAVIIILPFKKTYENPLWIIELFKSTMFEQYQYATLNAFNLYALLGKNWVTDTEIFFIFNYLTWGMIFLVINSLIVGLMFWIAKDKNFPIIATIVLNFATFMFSARMHERYLFPVLVFLLIAFIYYKKTQYIIFYAIISTVNFVNIWMVYIRSLEKNYWIPAENITMRIFSFINLIIFFSIVIITFYNLFKEKQKTNLKS